MANPADASPQPQSTALPRAKRAYAKPVRSIRLANARHENFAIAYLANGRNATKAAASAGYSQRTAAKTGSDILQRQDVRARIRALTDAAFAESEMSAGEVLARLAHVARFDVRKLYSKETGEAIPIKDLDEATAAAIVSFETELLLGKEGGSIGIATRKIKAADKIAALKILAQHHGIIGTDSGAGNVAEYAAELADRMELARRRRMQAEIDDARTVDMPREPIGVVDITSYSAQSVPSLMPAGNQDAEKSRAETGKLKPPELSR